MASTIQTVLTITTALIALIGSLVAAGVAAIKLLREIVQFARELNERREPATKERQKHSNGPSDSDETGETRKMLQELRQLISEGRNRRVVVMEGPSREIEESASEPQLINVDLDEIEHLMSVPIVNQAENDKLIQSENGKLSSMINGGGRSCVRYSRYTEQSS